MQSFIICCLSAELLWVAAPALESDGGVVASGACSWEDVLVGGSAGGGACWATARPVAASAVSASTAENRFMRLLLRNVTVKCHSLKASELCRLQLPPGRFLYASASTYRSSCAKAVLLL